MRSMHKVLGVLFFSALVSPLVADERLGIATGDIHGDQFHFGPPPANAGYAQIASIGAVWIRWDLGIVDITPTLNPEKLAQMQNGHAAGLKNCIIVRAPSPSTWADQYDPVQFPAAVAAFVQQYGPTGTITPGLIDAIEVLNEPNNGFPGFSGATATPAAEQALVTLTSNVTTAVHAVSPTTRVIGLGAQGQEIIDMLALNPVVDGIVYHPYDSGENVPEHCYEPTPLLTDLGTGGAHEFDYESWVALVKSKTSLPIWETEFAEDNGSDSYIRSVWLARRFFMSLNAGISHWWPYAWVLNLPQGQQMMDWANTDPRLPYYLFRHLEMGGIANTLSPIAGKPTFASTDPAFVAANAKGYLLQGTAGTAAAVWQGNTPIHYLGKVDAQASVSFPYAGTDASGSYVLNIVGWEQAPANVTLSGGIATVTGVDVGTEPMLIVLRPGSGPGPTPTPTPTPTPVPTPTPCPAYQTSSQTINWSTSNTNVGLSKPQLAGDNIIVKINGAQTFTVTDQAGDTFVQSSPGVWTATGVKASGWGDGIIVSFVPNSSAAAPVVISVEEDHCSGAPTPTPVQQVAVPNVVGMDHLSANGAITGAGLVVGSVTSQPSSTMANNLVISQAPASGTLVNPGSTASFVVSTGPTPTPAPTTTPTPTPAIVANLPAGVLPSGYTLQFNEDFTTYQSFTGKVMRATAGGVNFSGQTPWVAYPRDPATGTTVGRAVGSTLGAGYKWDGASDGDPFKVDSTNGLTIHANGNANPTYGGFLASSEANNNPGGFYRAYAYWEVKEWPPAGGQPGNNDNEWPLPWLMGQSETAVNGYPEIDINEGTAAFCGINIHLWPGDPSPNGFVYPKPLSSGFHIFGVLITPSANLGQVDIRLFLDGNLSWTMTGLSSLFGRPCFILLQNTFGPADPTTFAQTTNDCRFAYVRCWSGPNNMVDAPNLAGNNKSLADATVIGFGLVVGPSVSASSATVPAGNVISSSPAPGTMVHAGSTITETISTGP